MHEAWINNWTYDYTYVSDVHEWSHEGKHKHLCASLQFTCLSWYMSDFISHVLKTSGWVMLMCESTIYLCIIYIYICIMSDVHECDRSDVAWTENQMYLTNHMWYIELHVYITSEQQYGTRLTNMLVYLMTKWLIWLNHMCLFMWWQHPSVSSYLLKTSHKLKEVMTHCSEICYNVGSLYQKTWNSMKYCINYIHF